MPCAWTTPFPDIDHLFTDPVLELGGVAHNSGGPPQILDLFFFADIDLVLICSFTDTAAAEASEFGPGMQPQR
jgi:hypothetical protein